MFASPHFAMDRLQAHRERSPAFQMFVGLQRSLPAAPCHVLDEFLFVPHQICLARRGLFHMPHRVGYEPVPAGMGICLDACRAKRRPPVMVAKQPRRHRRSSLREEDANPEQLFRIPFLYPAEC